MSEEVHIRPGQAGDSPIHAEADFGSVNRLTVALVQLSAGTDVGANLVKVTDMLTEIGAVDVIALPEVFSVRGGHEEYRNSAEPVPGPTVERLAAIAAGRRSWLLAGSIIERAGTHIFNTSVLLDRRGEIAAVYRKIHLFEAFLEDGRIIRESDTYQAGQEPALADLEGWRCGLSICYDLRFPELYRGYAAGGAHVLFAPSNFTQRTGRDHWEVLVRARAVENQCYVVAPDQCGANPKTGIQSHGHSMAVDPWGKVLCCGGDGEEVLTVQLDPAEIEETRARIPVLEHRRL